MPQIILNDFSITPDSFSNGDTNVTVTYNCDIDDASQNPVNVNLFVLSNLSINIHDAKWEDTLQAGNNVITRDAVINAASQITEDKTIRFKIMLEDSGGMVASAVTTLIYKA